MKLIIAIIQDKDKKLLMNDLIENDYRVTQLSTTGGFLQEGNTTLLIGVEEDRVKDVLFLIEKNARKREVTTAMVDYTAQEAYTPATMEITIGGAVVFILEVDEFITL